MRIGLVLRRSSKAILSRDKRRRTKMPFKHKNIEYGLPHEQYPQEEINRCIDIWKEVLLLQSEPVAITLLFTKEDYELV